MSGTKNRRWLSKKMRFKRRTLAIIVVLALLIPIGLAEAFTPRSGPISTYPASWADRCGLQLQGTRSTSVGVLSSSSPGAANITLDQIYSKIINSPSFMAASFGRGWATTSWSLMQIAGPGFANEEVVGQFILVFANWPTGYATAYYDLQTGDVLVKSELGSFGSCPAQIMSETGGTLDRPSPAYYKTGEVVNITLFVKDFTVANMGVSSPNACLAAFKILRGSNQNGPEIYDSSKHSGCEGKPLRVTLNRGESYNQTLTWSQTNDAGQQVPPGPYDVMRVEWIANGSISTMSSDLIGKIFLGTPVLAVNSTEFQRQFYYGASVNQAIYEPPQPVQLMGYLSNNGDQTYELETSPCSFYFRILNLTNAVIYDSLKHSSCEGPLQKNYVAPPTGGISRTFYWNQTDDSGKAVGPGFYRAMISLSIMSDGHEFHRTGNSDFELSTPGGAAPSKNQISVSSSSICSANCGDSSPYLHSSVYTNGDLKSLKLYLNGTLIGTRNYNLPCCQLSYQVTFDTSIDNQTVPITPGVAYDIVFIGTFQDGSTSISWANPLNPPKQ